jgi:opacity protein-like surface antigen
VRAVFLVLLLAVASPSAAQTSAASTEPAFGIRLFGLATSQRFAAQETFNASFGSARGTFWGAGAEVDLRVGLFADVAVSRFNETGQTAFIFNGQAFPLGIPLTATITPVEFTAGYRLRLGPRAPVTPYAGVGVGSYHYQENSDFSDPTDNVDTTKAGLLAVVGAEVRVRRWLSVSADVQDTRITGILGTSGLSQQTGEDDLGGVAARFRILVGQ